MRSVDVALLSAVPLGRDDWMARAAAPPIGDLPRFHAETLWGGSAESAWENFAGRAGFMERKFAGLEHRGLVVVRQAARADVRCAAGKHANVVLLAHWKGPQPLMSDTLREPGLRLELWDSMISADELAGLFPADYRGTLHLAVCHSAVPAEVFRRRHPRALCLCHRWPVDPGIAMAKLDAAVDYMRTDRLSLWQALLRVADDIDGLA